MNKSVALVELFILLLLSIVTLIVQILTVRSRSIFVTWKQSAPLCLVLVSVTLLIVGNAIYAAQWILFALNILDNVPGNIQLFLSVANLPVPTNQFHNCASMALFAQRIYLLLYPLKKPRTFKKLVWLIVSLFFICCTVAVVYSEVIIGQPNVVPIPEGES
uniref:G_PROTEIN_RECEP_F1_2 domain-containing protein n=1 Tax=Steinernema glaseri TaxID=37863 RepID=A0A1I7Y985_9BILA